MQTKYIGTKSTEPVIYRCAWDVEEQVTPGSRFGPVVRGVYIVECNVYGYGSVIVNDREFAVTPGDTYILLPGSRVTHTAAMENPRRALWCAFGGMRVGKLLSDSGITPDSPFLPRELTPRVRATLEKILALSDDHTVAAGLMRTAALYELLAVISGDRPTPDNNHFVDRAVGIMESEYHTGITVADVAAAVGFDRSYFSTMFKEHTGTTPYAYLTSLRISHATDLMTGGDLPVSAVAEAVGLDPRNFARLFRRETGITPKKLGKGKRSPDKNG